MPPDRLSRRSMLGLAGLALGATTAVVMGRRPAGAAPFAQTGTPAASPTVDYPTGPGEIVVRVEYVGGWLPPTARLSELPLVSLYGDGRLVAQGPQIAIFPPPALPNLRQLYLTDDGIMAVLDAAEAAGLIGEDRRYENPTIADAAYTLITVNAGGETTRVAAYALGSEFPGLTPEERVELAAIQEFVGRMFDVTAWLPPSAIATGDEPYPIERLQVVAEPVNSETLAPDDPLRDQEPIDWPIETPLSAFDPPGDLTAATAGLVCGVVTDEEADALVAAAQEANALTPWVSEGQQYRVSFRPLLPDELGCPPRDLGLDVLPAPAATPTA